MEPVNGGQLKVGCVGCSDLAVRGVLPHLVVDDAKRMMALTAVCDIDPARAKATAQRFGATTWFSDYEQLLLQADVDVVLPSALVDAQPY